MRKWEIVVDAISGKINDRAAEFIRSRGFTRGVVKRMRIGSITSVNGFVRSIAEKGVTQEDMTEMGLFSERTGGLEKLSPNYVYFPYIDANSKPVALGMYVGSAGTKYANTSNTVCFRKQSFLYGINVARSVSRRKLYIVEGYTDVLTLQSSKIRNVVSVNSAFMSSDHATNLARLNLRNIVLAFDGDNAGRDGMYRAICEHAFGSGLTIRVKVLPDGSDPDSFVRKHGAGAFVELVEYDPVSWACSYLESKGNDTHDIAAKVVDLIAKETDAIARDKLCAQLALATNVPVTAIRESVTERVDKTKRETANLIQQEAARVRDKLSRCSSAIDIISVMREGTSIMQKIQLRNRRDDLSSDRDSLVNMISMEDSKAPGLDGAITGIKWLDVALDGFPMDGDNGMVVIGGKPNSGKSMFMLNIARSLLMRNDNTIVFYQTIDDTKRTLFNRWCACSCGLPINAVRNPNKYRRYRKLLDRIGLSIDEFNSRRLDGYQEIMNLVEQERLVVRDQSSGVSIPYARSIIEQIRNKYPDKTVYYFLDAFNNLSEVSGDDRRIGAEGACNELKNINHTLGVPTVYVSHYRKTEFMVRPNDSDLKETGILHYHPIVIMHIWNPRSEDPTHDELVWSMSDDDNGEPVLLPVMEVNVSKNKKSDFKGIRYLNFEPRSVTLYEPSPQDIRKYSSISSRIGTMRQW